MHPMAATRRVQSFVGTAEMVMAAKRPCTYPGCGVLVQGASRCEAHVARGTGSFKDPERGTRQQRGYGAEWQRTRQRILVRDNGMCCPCMREGRVQQAQQVDHIVNKAEGGSDDDANLQSICVPCHRAKSDEEARRGSTRRGRGAFKL